MEALYFNEDNIKELEESKEFEKFYEYWGISKFLNDDGVFMRNGKRYVFDRLHTTPCILMKSLDDKSILSFGVDSEIKDEFVLL